MEALKSTKRFVDPQPYKKVTYTMGQTMGCVYGPVVAIGNWVFRGKTDGITSLARLTTDHKNEAERATKIDIHK